MVGRVCPRHGRGARPLNEAVSRHRNLVNADFSFLVPCGIVAAASIPLMLSIVPPNRIYGFRTRQTLSNRELWFRANRFAGWAFFTAAGASAAAFILAPEYASGRSVAGLFIFVVPLVIALVASLMYGRKLAGEGTR